MVNHIVREAPPEHYPWLLNRIGLTPTANFKMLEAFVPDARLNRGRGGL